MEIGKLYRISFDAGITFGRGVEYVLPSGEVVVILKAEHGYKTLTNQTVLMITVLTTDGRVGHIFENENIATSWTKITTA